VDVEGRNAIAVFGGMIQQLTHRHEGHGVLLIMMWGDAATRWQRRAIVGIGRILPMNLMAMRQRPAAGGSWFGAPRPTDVPQRPRRGLPRLAPAAGRAAAALAARSATAVL